MSEALDYEIALQALLNADRERIQILTLVRSLHLPDGWIGAGFVRSAVWDHLHGRPRSPPSGDIDVIWFDPTDAEADRDRQLEAILHAAMPAVDWSVKNQARMHTRNGDPPYSSAADAMRYWPETATAIAARMTEQGEPEVQSAFGLDDLFSMILRPTPHFRTEKYGVYLERLRRKGWADSWPLLRVLP